MFILHTVVDIVLDPMDTKPVTIPTIIIIMMVSTIQCEYHDRIILDPFRQ
jgi:hypothetical protein